MKERRLSREVAVQILFCWEMQGQIARKNTVTPPFLEKLAVEYYVGHFLQNFYVKDKTSIDMPLIISILRGCVKNIVSADDLIEKVSKSWKLERMDAIDRAILRIATYEMAIKKTLSAKVIINEAIEIAKRYGSDQSQSFVNGILDAIKDKIEVYNS